MSSLSAKARFARLGGNTGTTTVSLPAGAALSVVGRAAATDGATAAIQAGADLQVLIRRASTLLWDELGMSDITGLVAALAGKTDEAYVDAAVAALIDSSPGVLDTLNELAAALGDDPNFATTIATALALKAPLANPALTGLPTAPTAAPGTNNTQIATTAYADAAVAAGGGGGGGAWSTVHKGSDTSRNTTTTLAADPDLTAALAATTRYAVRARVFYEIANATMDFKYQWVYTGTITSQRSRKSVYTAGAAGGTDNETVLTETGAIASSGPLSSAFATPGFLMLDAIIETNAAGDFRLEWAQNTSDAGNAKVLAGSYIEYSIVPP